MIMYSYAFLLSFVLPLVYRQTEVSIISVPMLSQSGGLWMFLLLFTFSHVVVYTITRDGYRRFKNIAAIAMSALMLLTSLWLLMRGFQMTGIENGVTTRLGYAPFVALFLFILMFHDWLQSIGEFKLDAKHAPVIKPIEVFLPFDDTLTGLSEERIVPETLAEDVESYFDYTVDSKDQNAVITGLKVSVEDLIIPKMIGKTPVKAIASGAFMNNQALSKVRIESGVRIIADNAFKGCRNIKEMKLPATIKEIGAEAFAGLQSLEQIRLPEGLRAISYGLFSQCRDLRSVVIPASVVHIGLSAFNKCRALEDVLIEYQGQKHAIRFEYGHLSPFARASKSVLIAIPKVLVDLYMKHMEWRSVASNVRYYDLPDQRDDIT